MKKLIFISLLTGCDASFEAIDVSIDMDAKQEFIAAAGTGIHIIEANAITPVTVTAVVEKDAFGVPTGWINYPVSTSCTSRWPVSTISGFDMLWLGVGVNAPYQFTVTYDASENQCAVRRCGGAYVASMAGQTGIVTIGCWNL